MNQDARQLHQLFKIGSARAGSTLAGLGEPLDALLPADAGAIDARLWLAMGALDLWERSGFQPAPAPEQRAALPAPPERLPSCSARAEALLALLLRGVHPAGLLPEWLQLLQRHGARLPARFLPTLLAMATRQAALRPLVTPVLGERGHWLANLQPGWAWAVPTATAAQRALLWDTGSPEQRVAALSAWREDDPAAARQALMATWASAPPEHRAALLPVLAIRLGLDDEVFLEAALDDRRKEVRAVAQRLLARLPGSQLGLRMRARLLPLLQLERRVLRAPRLQLALPAECDAAMRRDGVGAALRLGVGEKAGWIIDMLAAVDPAVWCEAWDMRPAALLTMAEASEFAAVLIQGWALASIRHADHGSSPWLLDLARWWIGAKPALRNALPNDMFDTLGSAYRHDAQDGLSMLVEGLPAGWSGAPDLVSLLRALADHGAGAWPPGLSQRVLQRVAAALPTLPALPQAWAWRQLLPSLALALDPATAVAASAGWHGVAQLDSDWRAPFDTFFNTVRLRHEMILSFQEPA